MVMMSMELLLEEQSTEEHDYIIRIEEVEVGKARLNISLKNKNGSTENSQGADLNSEECQALGEHLLAIAKRI